MHIDSKKVSITEDRKKKESLERIKNQVEQAKLNLKLASENNDVCEVKYWSKQLRLIQAILQKVQGIALKKSETP